MAGLRYRVLVRLDSATGPVSPLSTRRVESSVAAHPVRVRATGLAAGGPVRSRQAGDRCQQSSGLGRTLQWVETSREVTSSTVKGALVVVVVAVPVMVCQVGMSLIW